MPLEGSLAQATGNSVFQLESESSHPHFKKSPLMRVSPSFEVKSNSDCLSERSVIS